MVKSKFYLIGFTISIMLAVSCSKDEATNNPDQGPEGKKSDEVIVETEDKVFSIDENPYDKQFIGTVPSSTNSGSIEFSIVEQSPAGAMIVGSSTGDLQVEDVSVFDYELNTSVTGKIKVKNGSVSKISNIQINIIDIVEGLYSGDVELNSQEEVDEFGANNYLEISGKMVVWSKDDNGSPITDLSPLYSIEKIGGFIQIIKCHNLISLEGFNDLKSVGGVNITFNDNLEDINAFQNLEHSNVLSISSNSKLLSINTFSKITSLEGRLYVAGNESLTNLEGLQNLTTVGKVEISHNENLQSIPQFTALTTVNGDVLLGYLREVVNLDGLSNLQTIMGGINVLHNDNLLDIDGLGNLNTLNGTLAIQGNEKLENIDALSKLTSFANIQIYHCGALQNLDGLANLTTLEGYLHIGNNTVLNDFCGLSSLIDEDFSIESYLVEDNLYNPTIEDMLNNNCSN